MRLISHLVLPAALAACPALAIAQDASPPAASPAAAASPAKTGPVDTSALAYYASKHDAARVDAELHRLQRLYPDWKPPADPMAIPPAPRAGADDQPLWKLFADDRLDELDAEIARRKAADAAWTPPADLETKLAAKRARRDLVAASDRKDFAAVAEIAGKHPELLVPDDLDIAWRVAEAYGRVGRAEQALALDQKILDNRQDAAERLATVQKAMLTLPPDDLDRLIDKGHRLPDGRSEFESITLDRVRQRVGQALAASDGQPAEADLVTLRNAATAPDDGRDAALLGWVASKKKDWPAAATWFRAALKAGPGPAKASPDDGKVAQGAVQALQASGATGDAESLAYAWREADPALALQYINTVETDLTKPQPPVMAEDRLKRFSDVVLAQQSGEGAQALGWYAYNVHQFKPALAWFQKAMTWQPRDTTALGLALSLKQSGDSAAYAAFLNDNAATFPTLAGLANSKTRPRKVGQAVAPVRSAGPAPVATVASAAAETVTVPRLSQPAQAAAPAPRRRPPATHRQTARSGSAAPSSCSAAATGYASAAEALKAGWCLMTLDRPREASLAFAAARSDSATQTDAAYGEALASLRNNRTGDAIAAADSVPEAAARRSEIGLAALAQAAASAFDQGRYKDTLDALNKRRQFAAEPRDLAMLRAWSIYHIGDRERAHALFAMLNAQLSTQETRSGMATTDTPSIR